MRTCLCLLACSTLLAVAYAEKPRYKAVMEWSQPAKVVESEKPQVFGTSKGSDDALDEVNAYRAKRGLPPFSHDAGLTQAALACAKERARQGISGHLPSDFAYLPDGVSADAAGCGALDDSWGWATCCMDDSYSHAGAAWVRGSDGKRYMHLFVRHGDNKAKPAVQATPSTETVTAGSCANGSCGTASRVSRRRR